MEISTAFISYHHDDRVIARILKAELNRLAARGKGRSFLSIFLDIEDIPSGKSWKTLIDDNLSSKDWLIVLFTGEQSPYCGYEAGTFSQLHNGTTKKSIITLHDVEPIKLPGFLAVNQNRSIPLIPVGVDPEKVTLSADEIQIWFESSAAKFFKDFFTYKDLYTPQDENDDPGQYTTNIALAAKRISNAFAFARGTDIRDETPTQIGFEIIIKGTSEEKIDEIPTNAVVIGTSLFFNTLGLDLPINLIGVAPNTTWGQFKEMLKAESGREPPWLHKVEADVLRSISRLTVSRNEVTFRGQNGRVYRPIMVRHQLYVNGDRRFYLLLLETLDRKFAGSKNSSLLLTGLILASRLFFTYFERWNDTENRKFGQDVSDDQFWDACRQLIYNIDWIEYEAAELGADNEQDLIDAFGYEYESRVRRFFTDWAVAKYELFSVMPSLKLAIENKNREQVHIAVMLFLRRIKEQNADFLELALKAYSDELRIPIFNRHNV